MNRHSVRLVVVGALTVAAVSPWLDRPAAAQNPWARGTALGVGFGGASSSERTSTSLDAVVSWDVTPRVGVEGRGSWFGGLAGADAFSATLSGLVNLVPRQTVTPFVGAGFGFYRASFDSAASVTDAFYRNRLPVGPSGPGSAVAFTDPALRVAGGVDIMAHRHITIRPEAGVLFVRGGGNGRSTATFGVRFAYRFEDHPVTP